ncbi:interleukin-1 receptor-associated kinase 4-like isoform X2 [Tubulanus polymorphus]|uniref:interleukin-1 receptor-associated kinase 4-like isoform X2 n=1 Tax=Tubulanus polymorphus TaxID=672921 RepID=UPI003DA67DE8
MEGTSVLSRHTFIRNLSPATKQQLETFLDPNDLWKKLIIEIKLPGGGNKYSSNHVNVIECEGNKKEQSPTRILLMDWGTTNATLGQLITALAHAKIYSAADFLNEEVLQCGPVER